MNIDDLLKERCLPSVLSKRRGGKINTPSAFELQRERIIKLITLEAYGALPQAPEHMTVKTDTVDLTFAAGKAKKTAMSLHFELSGKSFSFPAISVIPKQKGPHPAFIVMGFDKCIPNEHLPAEEIIDRGYAILYFDANGVAKNLDDKFKGACAPFLSVSRRLKSAPGKLMMWAWGAMRLMDHAAAIDDIDTERTAVIGHGILGKAALIAGALDSRFNFTVANGSGTLGAALTRKSRGMSAEEACEMYPYLFSKNLTKSLSLGKKMPFDQHFLLSLIAPRHLLVGSAIGDLWSDYADEFLALCATNEVYGLYGKQGLVHGGALPSDSTRLHGGSIGYHLRCGSSYLSREDWNIYMDYIDGKRKAL